VRAFCGQWGGGHFLQFFVDGRVLWTTPYGFRLPAYTFRLLDIQVHKFIF